MKCRHVPAGHWAGVVLLLLGLSLSLAGVASPWWRVRKEGAGGPQCPAAGGHEGLWQQCYGDGCGQAGSETRCKFSERNAGWWRAVQVVKLMSLLFLTGGSVCSLACAPKRRCARTRCPLLAVAAALMGGVAGLVADLLYVGYTERDARPSPHDHPYHWAFALAVAGSGLSLLASLLLCLSRAVCAPKYISHVVQPYWPYHHYRIGADLVSYPHFYPYPGPYPELQLDSATNAAQKRHLFEQHRGGQVQVQGKVPGGHLRMVVTEPALGGYGKKAGRYGVHDGELGPRGQRNIVVPAVDTTTHYHSEPSRVSNAGRPYEGNTITGRPYEGNTATALSRQDPQLKVLSNNVQDSSGAVAVSGSAVYGTGHHFPAARTSIPHSTSPDEQSAPQSTARRDGRVFTVEKAVRETPHGSDTAVARHGRGPPGLDGERLVWQRPVPLPASALPPTVYLPQPGRPVWGRRSVPKPRGQDQFRL